MNRADLQFCVGYPLMEMGEHPSSTPCRYVPALWVGFMCMGTGLGTAPASCPLSFVCDGSLFRLGGSSGLSGTVFPGRVARS